MPNSPPDIPARFRPARSTLLVDQFMNWAIKLGGIAVIVAVTGIFVFILVEILPLFQGAKIAPEDSMKVSGEDEYILLGSDEWGELPFLLDSRGGVTQVNFASQTTDRKVLESGGGDKRLAVWNYRPESSLLALGLSSGEVVLWKHAYRRQFRPDSEDGITLSWSQETRWQPPAGEILSLSATEFNGGQRIALLQENSQGQRTLAVQNYSRSSGLLGGGRLEESGLEDLSAQLSPDSQSLLLSTDGQNLLVRRESGAIDYFGIRGGHFVKVQTFQPFSETERIAQWEFLFGDNALVLINDRGANVVYNLFPDPESGERRFAQSQDLGSIPTPSASGITRSLRNKSYFITGENWGSLRHGTTAKVRWEKELGFHAHLSAITSKYHRLLFLDEENRVHRFALDDPHPEASWRTYFGKIWYEGSAEPGYEWQSTGGTDAFEPKLSLIPLIFGTLKGTFYAMLFALPIALLAAIYTSQFLNPNIRAVVKPAMEIMASLPSVVLGFMGALWLAPLIETRVPSLLLIFFLLPLFSYGFGLVWNRLPKSFRLLIAPGYEFLVLIPLLLAVAYGGWKLGPAFEAIFFSVQMPSGEIVSDFRYWWAEVVGLSFEQRNCLIIGFMMGFAVIPIIFTISEDALSSVPLTLRSASLALGASRWQTAWRVILPTASAGIFSAVMVGLGRAVGETMIVVMATGNTPLMEWNIFSGMRTLSANIAVELPEAPKESTLYRTLFLGALLLFLLTFVVNTFAELLRQYLREKYKTV